MRVKMVDILDSWNFPRPLEKPQQKALARAPGKIGEGAKRARRALGGAFNQDELSGPPFFPTRHKSSATCKCLEKGEALTLSLTLRREDMEH